MQKRHNTSLKLLKTSEFTIKIDLLNLDSYKEEINNYENLNFPEQKFQFLINSLTNNLMFIDIFQQNINLYSNENNIFHPTNDYNKYCIKKLDNLLKNFQETKELNINISEDLIQKLMSELFTSNDLSVKYTLLNSFVSLSSNSKFFNKYISEDNKYMNYLFQFTYIKNYDMVISVLYIIYNIITDFPSRAENIINNNPFHIRVKELIYDYLNRNEKNNENIIDLVEILNLIISSIDEDEYEKFKDIAEMSYEIIKKTTNQKLIITVLLLIFQISKNDEVSKEIVSCGLGSTLQNMLSEKYCERQYLTNLLEIMINILYNNQISEFFLNSNILNTYSKILNTYRNTANKDDDEIIYLCIFCLSNIAGGPQQHCHALIISNLPSLILEILKSKNGNKIYFETCNLFYNILQKCSTEDFCIIIKMKIMKLFCEGLNKTINPDDILLSLKGLFLLIQRNEEIYKTKQNLKNEFFGYMAKRTLEKYSMNHELEISSLSEKILQIMGQPNDEDIF